MMRKSPSLSNDRLPLRPSSALPISFRAAIAGLVLAAASTSSAENPDSKPKTSPQEKTGFVIPKAEFRWPDFETGVYAYIAEKSKVKRAKILRSLAIQFPLKTLANRGQGFSESENPDIVPLSAQVAAEKYPEEFLGIVNSLNGVPNGVPNLELLRRTAEENLEKNKAKPNAQGELAQNRKQNPKQGLRP
jgi:hypothetical protein